jgi:hypothetical protein
MAVVLAIILVLVAITAGVVARVMGTQEYSVTETGIRKVNSVLRNQWDAVLGQADRDNIESNSAIVSLAGSDAAAKKRQRVIYKKAKLKQEFPLNFTEALTPSPLSAKAAYVKYLASFGITSTTLSNVTLSTDIQSAACLLMALTQGRTGSAISLEEFGGGNIKYVSDPGLSGGTPIPYLGDAWGNPLVFFRWPTQNAELKALEPPPPVNQQFVNVTNTIHDPQDPEGLLLNPTWWNSNYSTFEGYFHYIHDPTAATPTPVAFYCVPIIVSPGPDRVTGMNADGSVQATGATDNVYSFRLQKPGARGN